MTTRILLSLAIATAPLLALSVRADEPKPAEQPPAQPQLIEISDELLKSMLGPRIKEMLKNSEYRKDSMAQMKRALGDDYGELMILCMHDMHPRLVYWPDVTKKVRKKLDLPELSLAQIKAKYKHYKFEE